MKNNSFAWYQLSRREAALTGCIGISLLVLSIFAIVRSGECSEAIPQGNTAPMALVYINQASASELMALPGIGERKAQRIVEARKSRRIDSLDELAKVVGGLSITDQDRMRNHVAFE